MLKAWKYKQKAWYGLCTLVLGWASNSPRVPMNNGRRWKTSLIFLPAALERCRNCSSLRALSRHSTATITQLRAQKNPRTPCSSCCAATSRWVRKNFCWNSANSAAQKKWRPHKVLKKTERPARRLSCEPSSAQRGVFHLIDDLQSSELRTQVG